MAEWTSGYVVDVDYTHGFYRELSPSHLNYMCLLHGIQPPSPTDEPLTYCELGCGQGLTTNILAAANPHIRFYATDFNPSHIVGAHDLAHTAKLENVSFFDDSFAEFVRRDDLPEFDYIALHGIYSWISQDNRQAIVDFIRKKLKPGGIVYISYNTMPGWCTLMPFRRLLVEHAAVRASRATTTGIAASLEFAARLSKLDARYFSAHPAVATRLENLKTKDHNYIAHEYFNGDFNPFYFTDVAGELAEAKLTWIGSASALEIADELHLTPEQTQLLAEIDEPDFRQTIRDVMVNQQFRRDIFVRGPLRLPKSAVLEKHLDMRFALTISGADVPTKVDGSRSSVNINQELYEALVSAFSPGPKSIREALSDPGLAKLTPGELLRGINYLVGQGSCHPCLPRDGLAERQAQAERFNMAVAHRARHDGKIAYFASGATGSGIHADRILQLFWLAWRQGERDIPSFTWNILVQAGHRLVKNGQTLTAPEENIAELRQRHLEFEDGLASAWANLGLASSTAMADMAAERRLSA